MAEDLSLDPTLGTTNSLLLPPQATGGDMGLPNPAGSLGLSSAVQAKMALAVPPGTGAEANGYTYSPGEGRWIFNGSPPAGGEAATAAAVAMPPNNEQLLRKGMTDLGLNATGQAGLLSNFWYESDGLNPASNFPGGSAHGFAQWTGPRRAALNNFAAAQGGSIDDPNIQVEFMKHEITTQFPHLIDTLNNASSPQDAAEKALRIYEGINEGNSDLAGAPWEKMLRTHVANADNYFAGKPPKESSGGSSPYEGSQTARAAGGGPDYGQIGQNALNMLKPGAGGGQTVINLDGAAGGGDMTQWQRLQMMGMIQSLSGAGTHKFEPVSYDPFKAAPQAPASGGARLRYVKGLPNESEA
jgi:Phage tail lysozyme